MVSAVDLNEIVSNIIYEVRLRSLPSDELLWIVQTFFPENYAEVSILLKKNYVDKACDIVENGFFGKSSTATDKQESTKYSDVNAKLRIVSDNSGSFSQSLADTQNLSRNLEEVSSVSADECVIEKLEERAQQLLAGSDSVPSDNRNFTIRLSDDELLEVVEQRISSSDYFYGRIESLTHKFKRAAAPATPPLALPSKAPRLWVDRPDDERDMNAAAWIRKVYAPWLGNGLARQHIGELDPELGRAYSSWTRKERHPEDAIVFASRVAHNRITDDKEAISRRRDSSEKAKLRAKLDTMSQP